RTGETAELGGQGDEQVGSEGDEGVGPQSDAVQQMPLPLQADGGPHDGRGPSVQTEGGDVHESGPFAWSDGQGNCTPWRAGRQGGAGRGGDSALRRGSLRHQLVGHRGSQGSSETLSFFEY